MSENYTIGSYEVSTQAYYNALQSCGVTTDEALAQFDTNGDMKLTEDELMAIEITDEDEEETTEDTTTSTSTSTTVDEKIAQLEEAYEEKLIAYYEQLQTLQLQRRTIFNKLGTSDSLDTYESYMSQADSISDQIDSVNNSIVNLMTNVESQIASLKASASIATTTSDGTEYTVSTNDSSTPISSVNIDVNFTTNLTDSQKSDLELFKANWEKNKSRYEAVESATGVPAELIAAIHWREASGNFNSRLHDGGSLSGYSSWEEAAIDALTSGSYGTITEDISSWYDFAEHYNGMGYSNRGVSSPYVWAGTTNYTSGKYVADGVYDSGYVDKQLGVAVMLQAILT